MTFKMMSKIDRRIFLKSSGMTLAFVGLPRRIFADPTDELPHFFLHVQISGGLDPHYMFDSRPLSFTQAGKIANVMGEEPFIWSGVNGQSTWAMEGCRDLLPFKDDFSILNGVHMAVSFDGHEQNTNHVFTGNPFGGDSFIPYLNQGQKKSPLDFLQVGEMSGVTLNNVSSSASLSPRQAESFARTVAATQNGVDPARDFITSRYHDLGLGEDEFSKGVQKMMSGFAGSFDLARRLSRVSLSLSNDDFQNALQLIHQYFLHGIAVSAVLSPSMPIDFDVHSAVAAKRQPVGYKAVVDCIKRVLQFLKTTPFDDVRGISMYDVTTLMVASEFGRTNMQPGSPIDNTGTDHNPLCNQILIGGRGIRNGQVLGASDMEYLDEQGEWAQLSPAHRRFDELLIKKMGKPIDFSTGQPRQDLPMEYVIMDYLNHASVVNTLYSLFGIGVDKHWTLGRNMPTAPILRALLV